MMKLRGCPKEFLILTSVLAICTQKKETFCIGCEQGICFSHNITLPSFASFAVNIEEIPPFFKRQVEGDWKEPISE